MHDQGPASLDLSRPVIKDRNLDDLYKELVAMYHLPEGTREDIAQFLREMNDSTSERSKRLECLTRSIDIFKTLTDGLRLCRRCTMRSTPSNYARYCYVTCYASHLPAFLEPDPDGTLRLVFKEPPTIADMLAHPDLDPDFRND